MCTEQESESEIEWNAILFQKGFLHFLFLLSLPVPSSSPEELIPLPISLIEYSTSSSFLSPLFAHTNPFTKCTVPVLLSLPGHAFSTLNFTSTFLFFPSFLPLQPLCYSLLALFLLLIAEGKF